MKHFAFLVLATALFVNITWADPNENGILGRFKRARGATLAEEGAKALEAELIALHPYTYRVSQSTLSTAMKNYAIQQTIAFTKGKNFGKLDNPDSGRLSTTIQNAMKNKFGGNWFVMGCEADEYCSLSPNVSRTPITVMGCRQCLPLSVVQLKGKHCPKPHCRNGVVDTFELTHIGKYLLVKVTINGQSAWFYIAKY